MLVQGRIRETSVCGAGIRGSESRVCRKDMSIREGEVVGSEALWLQLRGPGVPGETGSGDERKPLVDESIKGFRGRISGSRLFGDLVGRPS